MYKKNCFKILFTFEKVKLLRLFYLNSKCCVDIVLNKSMTEDLNNNFNTIAPRLFLYDRKGTRSQNITEGVRKLYLKNQPVSKTTRVGLGQVSKHLVQSTFQILNYFISL